MKKWLLFVAVAAVLTGAMVLGLAVVASAATTWDGGGDGSTWDSPNNWNPDGVPSGGTEVRIDNGAQIQSAGTHSNAMVRVGYGTVNGTVNVTQTAGAATFSSFLTIGPTGIYDLQGGTLSTPSLYVGFDGGDWAGHHGTFIVDGGTLNVTGNMYLANQRVGEFRVVGGAGAINIASISKGDQFAGNFTLQPNGDALSTTTLSGSATLTGIVLGAAFSANPTFGHVFTVINKTSGGGVTGTFSGLAEGATYTAAGIGGNVGLKVSYVGGNGNDVTLEVMSVPAGDLVIEKHWDLNGDGNIGDVLTDPLLGGWTFSYLKTGDVTGLTVTDNLGLDTDLTLGRIRLAGLTPGSYTVTEQIPPGGWRATYDTDGGTLGTVLATVVASQTATVQFGNAIPEPAGLGLMGLLLLAVRKRRS